MTAACSLAWDAPLRNTFRVEARARCLATVRDAAALPALLDDPAVAGLPVLVLGQGSNVLFAAPRFEGLVIHLACAGVAVVREDATRALVRAEAAFGWDALVDWTLGRGLQGLENLALIPGQVGASPIQNIGAYGVEAGEFIARVHVHDRTTRSATTLEPGQCAFRYRDSVFKREPERWIVTAVEFDLPRAGATHVGYAGVSEELAAMGGVEPTPRNVAEAVRRIRRRKLPDPADVGNAGSFFRNPIVTAALAASLRERHPAMPVYPGPHEAARKLSAAWLIERAGWRGFRDGDAGMSAQHALVLVNHGRATGAQLLRLARRVAESVAREFDVVLEPEPRIVGAAF